MLEATWQDNSIIDFEWTDARDPFFQFDCMYYYQLNKDPFYEVTDKDILNGANRFVKIIFEETGHWYFHVRAKNVNGYYSPNTAHFHIMYNNIPVISETSYYVDNLVNPLINNNRPTFKWMNATDYDILDTLVYRLQISQDIDFSNILLNIFPIVEMNEMTSYRLTELQKLRNEGTYYWRIYAFDGNQESNESIISMFELAPISNDLSAKINIGTYSTQRLWASINIINYVNVNAKIKIKVIGNAFLNSKITVKFYDDDDLNASLFIATYEFLESKIHIIEKIALNGMIKVIDVPGKSDFVSRIRVAYYDDYEFYAKAFIGYYGQDIVVGEIDIIGVGNINLLSSLSVFVPSIELESNIRVIKSLNILLISSINIVYVLPGDVVLFANIMENIWQENNLIKFNWLPVQAGQNQIAGYTYKLDNNSTASVDISWMVTGSLNVSFDLENYDGAGIYYFHICAFDSNRRYGNITNFIIKYNHKPEAPSELMINGISSISENPIIGMNEDQIFSWNFSFDVDSLDIRKYYISIASDLEFKNIVKEVNDISNVSYKIDLNKLNIGYYYWRVRAFDGHEYSNWSIIGSFYINTPPSTPTELEVIGV